MLDEDAAASSLKCTNALIAARGALLGPFTGHRACRLLAEVCAATLGQDPTRAGRPERHRSVQQRRNRALRTRLQHTSGLEWWGWTRAREAPDRACVALLAFHHGRQKAPLGLPGPRGTRPAPAVQRGRPWCALARISVPDTKKPTNRSKQLSPLGFSCEISMKTPSLCEAPSGYPPNLVRAARAARHGARHRAYRSRATRT